MPPAVRTEFREFAEAEKHDLNEASLRTYWGNIRVLAAGLGLVSLRELAGPEGAKRLAELIERNGYSKNDRPQDT